jgi:predicted Zn finger-like uncharacterized protein
MRIICPSCTAEYEVPVSRVTQHRLVRCARCRNAWAPVPSGGDAVPPDGGYNLVPPGPESLPPVTAMDRLAAPPPGRSSSSALLAAWVVSLAVLASGVAAIVIWRDSVMHAWPASALVLAPFAHPTTEAASNATPKSE